MMRMSSDNMRRVLILVISLSMVVIGAVVVVNFVELIQKNDGSLICLVLPLCVLPLWMLMFWRRGRMVSRMVRGAKTISLSGYRRDTRKDD